MVSDTLDCAGDLAVLTLKASFDPHALHVFGRIYGNDNELPHSSRHNYLSKTGKSRGNQTEEAGVFIAARL